LLRSQLFPRRAATSRSSGFRKRGAILGAIVYDNFKGGLDVRKKSAISPAAVQYVLSNAYCTTGYSLKKRPCLRLAATLEPGTAGLKAGGGKLNTFYESGSIAHANPLFVANIAPHPTFSQLVTKAHFGEEFNGFLYAALEYADGTIWHQYFDGTNPPRITDANCPQTASVRKLKQKIYARSGANVRFCKTAAPRDWTTALDAGFLAAGAQAPGSDQVTALGDYLSNLVVFFSDSLQNWLVDPDPANMTLVTTAQLGTAHNNTAQTLAGDLIFLSKAGFRSVSNSQFATTNLQESDVGSPIDALRTEIADTDNTITIFYPVLGQLWTINGRKVYVYSFSKTAKLSAWSVFTFPVTINDATVLNGDLYLRSGDNVYLVDPTVYTDDGVIPLVEIALGFQSANLPGVLKQFMGFDIVATGSPSIAFKWDPNDESKITDYLEISGDTRPGDMHPMELCATSIAPAFQHQKNEAFELNALQLYFEKLGPV
jgi:hypothetical protein